LLRKPPAPRAERQSPQRGSERNRPSFIIKRGIAPASRTARASSTPVPMEFLDLFRKGESVARRSLNLSAAFPAFTLPGRARTLENHRIARQLKPNSPEPRPLRVPVKKSIVIQPSWCPRDSEWPTNSSALPTHMRDIDWRYFQLRCNPGTDTHSREGNVGASGTNQHRPIVLKRWKA